MYIKDVHNMGNSATLSPLMQSTINFELLVVAIKLIAIASVRAPGPDPGRPTCFGF